MVWDGCSDVALCQKAKFRQSREPKGPQGRPKGVRRIKRTPRNFNCCVIHDGARVYRTFPCTRSPRACSESTPRERVRGRKACLHKKRRRPFSVPPMLTLTLTLTQHASPPPSSQPVGMRSNPFKRSPTIRPSGRRQRAKLPVSTGDTTGTRSVQAQH